MSKEESKIPKHVAIIMDGNRRWAQKQGLEQYAGHSMGVETGEVIAQAARERGIEFLTLYALSLKNIGERTQEEIAYLYELFEKAFDSFAVRAHKENIRLRFIGRLSALPFKIQEKARDFELLTCYNTAQTLVIALAYDGHDEIVRAVQKIIEDGLIVDEITAENFAQYLDTAGLPPVDLMIRTAGEQRISGFLLWQASYAEYCSTKKFWPEFTEADLDEALAAYAVRERRHGGDRAQ